MLQQLANGLFAGAIYALFAIGFTLVFGILRHLNLAHAAIYSAGALIGIELVNQQGLPLWLAFPLAVLACMVLGLLLERVAFRPLAGRRDEHFAGLISSVAFGGMIVALLHARYGSAPKSFSATAFSNESFEFGPITVTLAQMLTMAVALVLMLGLAWVMSRSSLGRGMRAVAENPRAARVLGVNVERITASTYAVSSALGAAAGILMVLNVGQGNRTMGQAIELTGFAVIILGGMGSLWGAMAAGLLLGLAEALTVTFFDSSWKGAVGLILLFVILVTRPQGLFGQIKAREV